MGNIVSINEGTRTVAVSSNLSNAVQKWCFCMGLCCEMAGMVAFYQEADEYGHHFYMPYVKVGKQAHKDEVYDVAEENYRKAIQCFDGVELDEKSKEIVSSVYANLASALIMMHRLEEAKEALHTSEKLKPELKCRNITKAMIYALEEKPRDMDAALESARSFVTKELEKMLKDICERTHPHFFTKEISEETILQFWKWFAANQNSMYKMVEAEEWEEVVSMLQKQLILSAPFLNKAPEIGLEPDEHTCCIIFADNYMKSLEFLYARILEMCPKEIDKCWRFMTAH